MAVDTARTAGIQHRGVLPLAVTDLPRAMSDCAERAGFEPAWVLTRRWKTNGSDKPLRNTSP